MTSRLNPQTASEGVSPLTMAHSHRPPSLYSGEQTKVSLSQYYSGLCLAALLSDGSHEED